MLTLAFRVPGLTTQAGEGTKPTLGHCRLDGQVGLLIGGQEGLDAVQRHAGVDDLADELRQLEQRHAQHGEQRQRRERLHRNKHVAESQFQTHSHHTHLTDGTNTTPAYCYRQIAQNIDLIVQMARIRDRETGRMRRVVTEISEIQPGEDSYGVARPTLSPIFAFDRTSHTLELGTLPSRGLLEKLADIGYDERELSPYGKEEAS